MLNTDETLFQFVSCYLQLESIRALIVALSRPSLAGVPSMAGSMCTHVGQTSGPDLLAPCTYMIVCRCVPGLRLPIIFIKYARRFGASN